MSVGNGLPAVLSKSFQKIINCMDIPKAVNNDNNELKFDFCWNYVTISMLSLIYFVY